MIKVPLVSRLICRFLWHSYRGVINDHGAMRWLVCGRCGHKHDLIFGWRESNERKTR
jgi:hypothetical protein